MKIGNKIINLRKKHNITQEKLSETLGVSRQTLSNWENNITSPDLSQAALLSKTLKISLDELIDNNLDIECKENKLLENLIGKTCYLNFVDDFFDLNINETTKVKVININQDFIKIEYLKNKKKLVKLIDIDLILSIKVVERSN